MPFTATPWASIAAMPIRSLPHSPKIASSISVPPTRLCLDFPVMTGRQAILDSVLPLIGPLDTSHTATNFQIEISDDSATLSAYVMSQHFMPREGSRRGAENALLMNRYDCELTRDGQKWRFNRITIDNAWSQGDPEILNALAIHRVLTSKRK